MNRWLARTLRTVLLTLPLGGIAACHSLKHQTTCDDTSCEPVICDPLVSQMPSMLAIAADLDHLEKHIDWYGSVVAKSPDVWGEARLTSYRHETESRLRNELDGFRPSLQGSLSRTDTATLLMELSFNNMAKAESSASDAAKAAADSAKAAKDDAEKAKTSATAAEAAAKTSSTNVDKLIENLKAATDALNKASQAKANLEAGQPVAAQADSNGVVAAALNASQSLEPVRILDQKARYLNYLSQLRRTNEGDDTSDAPGYSLNLVRLPVSLLPGKRTDVGHGAEVTFTINPVLDEELLPQTTRDLLVNDITSLMAFPIAKLLEGDELTPILDYRENDRKLREVLMRANKSQRDSDFLILSEDTLSFANPTPTRALKQATSIPSVTTFAAPLGKLADLATRVVSYSIDTKGNRPIPSAFLLETIGPTFLYEITRLIHKTVERQTNERGGFVHVPDVQALLREQLIAAYRFLKRPENKILWDCYATQDLAHAVRNRNIAFLQAKREEFRTKVQHLAGVPYSGSDDPNLASEPYRLDILVQFSATSGLAWAILLDAALLNERLVEDMRRTASTKGVPQLKLHGYHEFCLPHPAQHHRDLFNLYVKSRWPIHVFTLDPMTDDQNIDDQLKQTREMQLTLTLAYVWGKIGTRSYTNATRKLSAEYQTIAINRTQVGFTHGENVFGWRFYPRFQSPDTQSNLTVFVRDTLIGGPNRNALLRQRRLEPGPRECTAIVLMPSFVPNATLDVTTNWFGLANPKHKVFDHTQAMKLSRTIQAIRVNGGGVKDESCYRAGDLRLLQNRAEQLSARLPFQSMTFQVPALNTLGGFELFGNSTTDLAPELYGWYGAPGIEPGCELFLVGDHFSVNHTRVMIGNYAVPMNQIRMLSRQVMSVRVPDNILLASESAADGDGHVDIHIATPYGVSRDLKILLAKKKVSIGKKEDTKKEETKKEDTKKPSAIVHELAPSPKSTAIVANPN